MRLADLPDYLRLRRHLRRPWAFLRLRGQEWLSPFHEVDLQGGATLRIRGDPMDRHILHRIFGRDEYRLDRLGEIRRLDPGRALTIVDVGAHVGLFAARAAPWAARILSFEPAPKNLELLRLNTRQFPQVEVIPMAVAGRSGQRRIRLSADHSGHTFLAAGGDASSGTVEVECLSLEEIFTRFAIERCDLLKLDVEGAEHEILSAAPPEIWPRIERIALEYHPLPGATQSFGGEWTGASLVRRLESQGYRVEILPAKKNGSRGRIFAERPS